MLSIIQVDQARLVRSTKPGGTGTAVQKRASVRSGCLRAYGLGKRISQASGAVDQHFGVRVAGSIDDTRGRLRRAVEAMRVARVAEHVQSMTLFQSILSPAGARYVVVGTFPFGEGS